MAMWTWPDAVSGESAEQIVARLQAAHIDIVIPYLPIRDTMAARAVYEERIGALVEEAHRVGMTAIGCFDEMGTYDAMPAKEFCQVRQDGVRTNLLCPANPGAREYLLGELARLLAAFPFDGINLEDSYVYNPTTIYDPAHSGGAEFKVIPVCYCDHCRAHAPIEKPEWAQWRRDRLTELIAAEGALVHGKGLSFSVAARMPYARDFYAPYEADVPYYGGWEFCQARDGLSADWLAWLQTGIIDFACPMSYFHNDRLVELETLECQARDAAARQRIWVGLGLDAVNAEFATAMRDYPEENDPRRAEQLNDGAAIRRQLDIQARLGQEQVLFFSHAFLKDDHIAVIKEYR
jgi:uncharacterized lipoprotein YddW (UPF0748 family)